MDRIKNLNRYQKAILIIMAFMVVLFGVIYSKTISREGFLYNDVILVPKQDNDTTIYSGKLKGEQAVFTVDADKTVVFQHGDTIYGPYTANEDPTAIPKDKQFSSNLMIGVEIYKGNDTIFRGGVLKQTDEWWLFNEDGTFENFDIMFSDGYYTYDGDGNVVDPVEPSASTVIDLMAGPKLTHKGEWMAWFMGVVICVLTAVSILYVEELFRWNLSFQIRNVEKAEPSEWEIAGRYISWTLLPVLALVVFVIGLQ